MHSFLHGIRRSFLRPVWAPLPRCLPLLALLNCCPEEGELLPPIVDDNDGDLLPNSGVDDNKGDLLPTNGDEKGDLPPLSGEDYQQKGSLADADHMNLQPHLHGGHDEEEAELNLHSAPIDGQHQDVGALLPMKGDDELVGKSLLLTTTAMDENLTKDGGAFQPRRISNDGKKLQNWYAYDVRLNIKDDDGLAEPHPHQFPPWVMPIPQPRVKMKGEMKRYDAHAWKHDAWVFPSFLSHSGEYGHDGSPQNPHHDRYSIILAITFSTRAFLSTAIITSSARVPNSAAENEDISSLLLLLQFFKDDVHGELAHIDTFLIPLRGRKCNQWNDEASDEDVAAFKMKPMRRRTTMRLSYINKDLLDPG